MSIEDKSLEEQVEELKKIPGNVKGEVFRTHATYIRHKEGEEGLERVEERLSQLGCPLELMKANTGNWYPEHLSALVILVAKEVFNWTEENVFQMGNSAPKLSFIVKIFVKHFASLNEVLDNASQYWKKHYDFGSIKIMSFDEKEKYVKIKVEGYKFHPLICGPYFSGYFKRIAQFSIESENIKVQKTKCNFEGDPHDEYLINW